MIFSCSYNNENIVPNKLECIAGLDETNSPIWIEIEIMTDSRTGPFKERRARLIKSINTGSAICRVVLLSEETKCI